MWFCIRGIALPPLGVPGVIRRYLEMAAPRLAGILFGIGLCLIGVLFVIWLASLFVYGVIVRLSVGSCLDTPIRRGKCIAFIVYLLNRLDLISNAFG